MRAVIKTQDKKSPKNVTILAEKRRHRTQSQLGFPRDMFGMHESIVADFWTTLIIVNNFYGRRRKKYLFTKYKYCWSISALRSEISTIHTVFRDNGAMAQKCLLKKNTVTVLTLFCFFFPVISFFLFLPPVVFFSPVVVSFFPCCFFFSPLFLFFSNSFLFHCFFFPCCFFPWIQLLWFKNSSFFIFLSYPFLFFFLKIYYPTVNKLLKRRREDIVLIRVCIGQTRLTHACEHANS